MGLAKIRFSPRIYDERQHVIQLVLASNDRILIESERPEELATAIGAVMPDRS